MRGARPGWSHWGPQHRLAAAGPLAIALCATGCFSDRGVAIEVDIGETKAASVEMYIGKAPCDSPGPRCKTITPPNAVCALSDHSWFRDDAQPYTAKVQGHKATFRIESDTAITLPIVIAVGLDASSTAIATATLRDLPVPVNKGQIATTMLIAANPVKPAPTDTRTLNEDRVQVWTNQKMPPGECVVVEHWRPGVDPQRDSVVPADDPECNDGMIANTPEKISFCAVAPATPDACTLGVQACNADGSIGTTCAPLPRPVCIPDQLCPCTSSACIATNLETLLSPRIDCTIPLNLENATCGGEPAEVNLMHDCGPQPQIAMLPFDGFAQSAMFNGVTIKLGTASRDCRFSLNPSGSATETGEAHGVVQLATKAGTLLLPIHFTFVKGVCPAQPSTTCIVTPDDTNKVWTCTE